MHPMARPEPPPKRGDAWLILKLNRALSVRSNKSSGHHAGPSGGGSSGTRRGFSLMSLRGSIQPELSRRLYRLIKSQNNLISAHETAGKERASIAAQLSEWGEHTKDPSVSDISDKLGVVLAELGELDENYAHALDDARAALKSIRNTEKSVQPSRDGKGKAADEIARIKLREPDSPRLVILEQELVRAEAENLVAEAQLTNITRQKLGEAYAAEFAATIERAEKEIILAKHGQRLLALLDGAPAIPGDGPPAYRHAQQARQILNDAEDDLREWQPETSDVTVTVGNRIAVRDGDTFSTPPTQSPVSTHARLQSPTTSPTASTADERRRARDPQDSDDARSLVSGTVMETEETA